MTLGVNRYLWVRLARGLVTIAGVVTMVFLLVRIVPGDPVDAMLGEQVSPEQRSAMREALLLDRPFLAQYSAFLGNLANGTLGTSFRHPSHTVMEEISAVLPHTIVLAIAALFVAWAIAVPLGTVAATRHRTVWDRFASGLAVMGLAIPNIWLGPLLVLFFAVMLQIAPFPGDDQHPLRGLVLPAFTVGSSLAAVLTRQVRASMLEVLQQPYIVAARARGVSSFAIAIKHALRNALLPVVTIGAAQLGALLSGTVVTEKIFEREGLGTLFLEAFFARDIPVVQGCVLVIAVVYVTVNLLVDIVYMWIDPRVRLG